MPSNPYSSLSATRRLNQRYRTLWGLGIGECRAIAAQRPTVLRDILAEFNRRAQRRSRVYPNPPLRMVVVTPAGERQAGSSPQRVGGTKSIGPNGLRAPTKGPLVIGSGRRS